MWSFPSKCELPPGFKIHSLLKSMSEAFKSGDPDMYGKIWYDLRKTIRGAKRRYRTKLEPQINHTDTYHLSCVDQLAGMFTDIFDLSWLRSEVPTCFKKTTIISVPKERHAACLNDYCLVALTSIIK
eukprot:g45111.t1